MNLYICLFLTVILMFYALIKNALTPAGLVFAGLLTFGMTYFGGYPFYVMILLIFFTDKVFSKLTNKTNDKTRDAYQIIAVLFVPFVAVINYKIFNNILFIKVATAVLAASLADNLASIIGRMAKHHLYLGKTYGNHHELSGSVSIMGTLASLMGALIIGIVYFYMINSSFKIYILIGLIGILGSLIDSFIGVYIQALYECPKCKKITEETKHCNKDTKLLKGLKFVNNSMVNFVTEVLIFFISLVVL